MKRRDMLKVTGAAVFGAATSPWPWAPAAEGKPQRVLYFTRNVGFYHSVVQRKGDQLSHSERILVALGREAGIEVTCTKDGRVFDGDLGQYDAFVFYTNGDLTQPNPQQEPPMTAEGKRRFLAAVEAGKGFLGFHSTCNCWHSAGPAYENGSPLDPFIAMLGGEFIAHGPQQKATLFAWNRFMLIGWLFFVSTMVQIFPCGLITSAILCMCFSVLLKHSM